MQKYIEAEDSELWDVICDGPFVSMKTVKKGEVTKYVPKIKKEYTNIGIRKIEKNFKAKKILVCNIEPDEYNRVSAYENVKEIWEALLLHHSAHANIRGHTNSKVAL